VHDVYRTLKVPQNINIDYMSLPVTLHGKGIKLQIKEFITKAQITTEIFSLKATFATTIM